MGIPIFKPLLSRHQTEKEWRSNPAGMPTEIAWAFTISEMMGMIETRLGDGTYVNAPHTGTVVSVTAQKTPPTPPPSSRIAL